MKEMSHNEKLGTFLVVLTAIISAFNIVANKYFIAKVDPLIFTAIRALLIGIVFLVISLFLAKNSGKKFKQTSWKNLVLIGIVGGGIAFWMFFTGLSLTDAGRAAFIHKTLPVYAIILAVVFLKEKITRGQIIASAIMLFGLIIMELSKISSSMKIGDLLILGATILWAIENTISKKAMINNESNFVVTFARMFFGSLVLIAIILLTNKWNLLLALNSQQWTYILVSGFLLLLYVLTWYWGLKHINLSKASTIMLISPVLSLIFAMTLLGEKALPLQLIGSALILLGSYFIIKQASHRRK